VNFTREELRKIKNLFSVADQNTLQTINDSDCINFLKISHQLGLHRDSYNFLSSSMRVKSLRNLKQLYRSIEPVEEENEDAEIQQTAHKKNKS
jgi:hypothetical protein